MIGNRACPRSAPSRHRRGWRGHRGLAQVVAVAVALAGLGAQVSSLGHLTAAPHIRCQEHGELEDLPTTAHLGEVAHDQASVENRGAPDPGQGHEHCVFAAHARHTQANDPVYAQGVASALIVLTAAPKVRASRAPRLLVYRLAPKTSPPA